MGVWNSPKLLLLNQVSAQETHITPLSGSTIRPLPIIKSHLPLSLLNSYLLWGHKASSTDKPHQYVEFGAPPQTKV